MISFESRYTANLAAFLVSKAQTEICGSIESCAAAGDIFCVSKGTATHDWVEQTFPNINEASHLHISLQKRYICGKKLNGMARLTTCRSAICIDRSMNT